MEDSMIIYSATITNILSILGSTFVIIAYCCIKEIQMFSNKLVMYLAISDIINAIAQIALIGRSVHIDEHTGLCKLQAFLINYGNLSSVVWVILINLSLYLIIVKGHT